MVIEVPSYPKCLYWGDFRGSLGQNEGKLGLDWHKSPGNKSRGANL